MAELGDLRVFGYQPVGDSGFGAFGDQAPAGFQRVGYSPQGGLLSGLFKAGKSLLGKIVGGGSSKLSKAAKAAKKAAIAAGKSPVVQAAGVAAATDVVISSLPGMGGGGAAAVPVQLPSGEVVAMRAPRAPSIIFDNAGRAWRRAGRPVLWSGDLSAVRRVNKAASRARRASGSRRSVRR